MNSPKLDAAFYAQEHKAEFDLEPTTVQLPGGSSSTVPRKLVVSGVRLKPVPRPSQGTGAIQFITGYLETRKPEGVGTPAEHEAMAGRSHELVGEITSIGTMEIVEGNREKVDRLLGSEVAERRGLFVGHALRRFQLAA